MTKYTTYLIGIIFTLVVVIGGVAYFENIGDSSETGPLKFGFISVLSGQYAVIGENHQKGFALAHAEYLKEYPERQVEIFIEDDQFDSKRGLSAYKKLTEINGIDALFNVSSPTINVIHEMATAQDLPVIQTGEEGYESLNDSVFQILPSSLPALIALGEHTKEGFPENTSIAYSNEATIIKFFERFQEGYENEFLGEYKLIADQDFWRTATQILAGDPEAVVIIAFPEQGARLVQELERLLGDRDKPQFILDANLQAGIEDYRRILGDLDFLEGAIVQTIKQVETPEFAVRYRETYGEEPGVGADWGYDGFNLLIETYNSDRRQWLKNIQDANFEGVSGLIAFDEVGIRQPLFEIQTLTNGEL